MSYTASDNFTTTTTAAALVGAVTLDVQSTGTLCNASISAPAWVQITSNAGSETVKVIGCTSGKLSISQTTLGHSTGACVKGFTLPKDLICAMMQACAVSPCPSLEIVG